MAVITTFTLANQTDTFKGLTPIAAPIAPTTGWVLYVDAADNKLKAIASTGTIVILGTP